MNDYFEKRLAAGQQTKAEEEAAVRVQEERARNEKEVHERKIKSLQSAVVWPFLTRLVSFLNEKSHGFMQQRGNDYTLEVSTSRDGNTKFIVRVTDRYGLLITGKVSGQKIEERVVAADGDFDGGMQTAAGDFLELLGESGFIPVTTDR